VNLIAGSLANSIFFYVYADGKQRYGFDSNHPNSWTTALISMRAGMIAQTLTLPFWVVKTRLALDRNTTNQRLGLISKVVKDMLKNEGPLSFFKGFLPSLLLSTYGII
jgi:hypothetical protein